MLTCWARVHAVLRDSNCQGLCNLQMLYPAPFLGGHGAAYSLGWLWLHSPPFDFGQVAGHWAWTRVITDGGLRLRCICRSPPMDFRHSLGGCLAYNRRGAVSRRFREVLQPPSCRAGSGGAVGPHRDAGQRHDHCAHRVRQTLSLLLSSNDLLDATQFGRQPARTQTTQVISQGTSTGTQDNPDNTVAPKPLTATGSKLLFITAGPNR